MINNKTAETLETVTYTHTRRFLSNKKNKR